MRLRTQFFRFCMVGLTNTLVDVTFYFLLTRYLGFVGEAIYVAKGISFAVATFNSFIFNRLWTFKQAKPFIWSELVKFYIVVGSGVVINLTVHYIDTQFLHINDLISAGVSALFTATWGFIIMRNFIFK